MCGVALLEEITQVARHRGPPVRIVVNGRPVKRALELGGLNEHLSTHTYLHDALNDCLKHPDH